MKIICVGRNYAEHVKELNNPVPKEPILFIKPDSALLRNNETFFIPEWTDDCHYEAELFVRINKPGKHIQEKFAHSYYDQIGIGIDITARDVQAKCKEKGHPWERAKGFDGSAPISKLLVLKDLPSIQDIRFTLLKNGDTVQNGHTADMLFKVNSLISEISKYFTLKIGDLIFTGTPAGVGKMEPGDKLEAFIEDRKMMGFLVK
ncbi:MAG: acylpyruvate hydrolase [Granulosicoccus sp.]|jgi:acylpyruvate hydrolase